MAMFRKATYCSTPKWLPSFIRNWFENKYHFVCKAHDNARGIKGQAMGVSKAQADLDFYQAMLRIDNSLFGKLTAKISYLVVKHFHKEVNYEDN